MPCSPWCETLPACVYCKMLPYGSLNSLAMFCGIKMGAQNNAKKTGGSMKKKPFLIVAIVLLAIGSGIAAYSASHELNEAALHESTDLITLCCATSSVQDMDMAKPCDHGKYAVDFSDGYVIAQAQCGTCGGTWWITSGAPSRVKAWAVPSSSSILYLGSCPST